MLWGGGITANKYRWHAWGVLTVFQLHWICPHPQHMRFPSLHLDSRLLCQELSEAGPGLHALPRSKPLRFKFLSTPQRRRLSWACALCPSHVWASQVTRYLASAVTPRWAVHPTTSPVPAARLSGCTTGAPSQACLLKADFWVRPCQWMSSVQNPKNSWLAMEPICSLVEDASLGLRLPLSSSGCPLPACLWQGMGWSAAG